MPDPSDPFEISKIHETKAGSSTQVSPCGWVLPENYKITTKLLQNSPMLTMKKERLYLLRKTWYLLKQKLLKCWVTLMVAFAHGYLYEISLYHIPHHWILILLAPRRLALILQARHWHAVYNPMHMHPVVPVFAQKGTQASWCSRGCTWTRSFSCV